MATRSLPVAARHDGAQPTVAAPTARDLAASTEPRRAPNPDLHGRSQQVLVLMPSERRVYRILEEATGRAVTVAAIQAAIDGAPNPDRYLLVRRLVGKIQMALRAEGRFVIRSTGTLAKLAFTLIESPTAVEDPVEVERRRDAEVMRLHRLGLGADRIAVELGFENRNAVLARISTQRHRAASEDAVAVVAAPEGKPTGITLPPCGYAAWSFDPDAGEHQVLLRGEGDIRVLSRLDREMSQLTTECAQILRASSEGEAA